LIAPAARGIPLRHRDRTPSVQLPPLPSPRSSRTRSGGGLPAPALAATRTWVAPLPRAAAFLLPPAGKQRTLFNTRAGTRVRYWCHEWTSRIFLSRSALYVEAAQLNKQATCHIFSRQTAREPGESSCGEGETGVGRAPQVCPKFPRRGHS